MKKVSILLGSALLLAACRPTGPITGTEEQKAQKLGQIIASGGSAACTVTNLSDNSMVEFVVSGKKMKIVGSDLGQGKRGTMLNDSVYTYIWSEGEKSGFKSKNQTEEDTKGEKETSENDFDTDEQVAVYDDETKFKMDCRSGGVSDSEFVPPSDVQFVDPSELRNMTPEQLQKLYPDSTE